MSQHSLFPFSLFLVLDWLSKSWAVEALGSKTIQIVDGVLSLRLVHNDGIAFGIFIPGLEVITVILIAFLVFHYFRYERKKSSAWIDVGYGSILAGAVGNGWQRLFLGEVTDFIAVRGFSVFNVADVAISVGVISLFTGYFLSKNSKYQIPDTK